MSIWKQSLAGMAMSLGMIGSAHALANPAAVHCKALGGQLTSLRTSAGEASFCRFGGALVSDWTMYRATKLKQPNQATKAFLLHDGIMPSPVNGANPAAIYCANVGGYAVPYQQPDHGEVGICQFPDNSQIEEWTLFRGPNDASNSTLKDLLAAR